MTQTIKYLDPVCISKIAAGEVIERTASVVKELIENSIDASATEIQVAIKKGGKNLIEIQDNGVGISPEDLPIAIKRHTTSKISSDKDLMSIKTLGFRGEALYSIASVSKFLIMSKTANDELATVLSVEGDVDKTQIMEKVMANPGTIVQVRDLFFNFPVRRKFLKKDTVEEGYIYDVVTQYAIAHPEISFTLNVDEKIEFQTFQNQDRLAIIKETLGNEIASSLLDIGIIQQGELQIHGYISKPGFHKRNRKYQFFYLNGRRIFSKLIQSALEEGYGTYLMKHEFPIAFLFLEVNPQFFDCNIHPQKREVLFFDEKALRTAISTTISHCMKVQDIVPRMSLSKAKHTQRKLSRNLEDISVNFQSFAVPGMKEKRKLNLRDQPKFTEISRINDVVGTFDKETLLNLLGSEVIFRGPLAEEFILLEDSITHDLIILDFHASHERVNLENLINQYQTKKVNSQTFLKPFRFNLTSEQESIVKTSLSYFEALGFDIRIPKGEKRVIEIFAIPEILIKTDLKKFLLDLFDNINEPILEEQLKNILSIIACHSAYKSGELLSFRQTKELLEKLSQTENPTICAHGRPTHIKITHQEMLKQVKRIK